ncbi:MAG: FAD-binding oxidoreductase [Myxococcota bacterium]
MSNPRPSRARLQSLPTGAAAPPNGRLRELSGWGQYPVVRGVERVSEDLPEITRDAILSRGLGRAYGDASLPPEGASAHVAGTPLADRLLSFDSETGWLRAEAGLSLKSLNEILLPQGWVSPVSPGTAFVTLGGMVASDVHAKNHHVAGCFGAHVRALRMRVADGRILEVTEENEPELFHATFGGMGLTGHVLEVEFRMTRVPSPWIRYESERVGSLDELLSRLVEAGRDWPSTVAWVDCTARGAALGRGILMKGRWATASEAPQTKPPRPPTLLVPCRLPNGLVNRYTLRVMNSFFYWKHAAQRRVGIGTPDWWFHPLDKVAHWHRVFGARGFTQYQCVIPSDAQVCRDFLTLFQREGGSSFVSVLKDCGAAGQGPLSFPQPGASLALDIPIQGEKTRRLVARLNEFVIQHAGRIYLAKDAFTTAEHLRAMYPRLAEWEAVRQHWDPEGRLASAQSQRLFSS